MELYRRVSELDSGVRRAVRGPAGQGRETGRRDKSVRSDETRQKGLSCTAQQIMDLRQHSTNEISERVLRPPFGRHESCRHSVDNCIESLWVRLRDRKYLNFFQNPTLSHFWEMDHWTKYEVKHFDTIFLTKIPRRTRFARRKFRTPHQEQPL